MSGFRSHDDYVSAAAAALAERGPVRGGREISLSRAATTLGTTRSKLYRQWETSADLAAALNVHTATRQRGWRQIVMTEAPHVGLAAAIDLAAADRHDDTGLRQRAVVAAWPTDSVARREIAMWERRWFDDFATLLATSASDTTGDPRPWTDAAIAITALVEGTLLLSLQMGVPAPPTLGTTVERHLRQLVEMTTGDVSPVGIAADDGPNDVVEPDGPADDLIRRLADLVTGPTTELPAPTRLVDLELLARRLDVHPRRLYAVWPTVHDLNGDLAVYAVRSLRELTERLTMATISATIGQGHTHFRDLFVTVLDAIIQGSLPSAAAGFLACSFAIDDPEITPLVVTELTRWLDSQKVALLALLQVIGFHLLPGVDPDIYVGAAFGATYGCMRIAALHPDLVERPVVMLGAPVPTLPAGVNALFRSMTEPCDHEPRPDDRRHSMAPPIII